MVKILQTFLKSHHHRACCTLLRTPVLCYSKIFTNCKESKSKFINLQEANEEKIQLFLNSFDTVLTDCDGVLWNGKNALPGSADALNYLRKSGKKIYYVTNANSLNRLDLVAKANNLGFPACQDDFFSAGYLVAHYLKSIRFTKKVYIIGTKALCDELDAVDIRHIGLGPDNVLPMTLSNLDSEVGAVVVGYDEDISYAKLMRACNYLSSKDCIFLAPHDSLTTKRGSVIMPSVGTLLKAVEVSSGRKALVLGKPYDYFRKIVENIGVVPEKTLMIGDRFDTDIEFGVRSGYQTLLVLSGDTTQTELEKIREEQSPPLPDFVLQSLGELLCLVRST